MSPFTFVAAAVAMLWLLVLFASRQTRFEQLTMSVFGLLLVPVAMLMVSPVGVVRTAAGLGFSTLVFVSALFGLSAVAYHLLLGPHATRLRGVRMASPGQLPHWVSRLMIGGGIWAIIAIASEAVLAVRPVQAFTLGGLLVGIYVIADHHDLLLKAMLTGLFSSLLVLVVEGMFSTRLFTPSVPPFHGLPVEEFLWAGIIGFTVGPLYEYVRHVRATT